MEPTTLLQIAEWAGGKVVGNGDLIVSRVTTDSRQAGEGSLFVALIGERFDGHDFVKDIAKSGAVAALVREGYGERVPGFPVIEVDDTLSGLQRLASGYRNSLSVRVVGVTGSNGKTSTKEFVYAVLAGGGKMVGAKTQGNLNNHIGVPLTLLSLEKRHAFAVVEMGMNHAGEIAPLAAMARPEVAIITNVGVAHIEHLGSQEAIADEKGALAQATGMEGFVVLNAGDKYAPRIAAMTSSEVVWAGVEVGDVQAVDLQVVEGGTRFGLVHEGERAEVLLGVAGRHMVCNAALAAAAGIVMGVTLREAASGLSAFQPIAGRMQVRDLGGIKFLDDTYNANPDSMEAALVTLAQWPVVGKRIAVLGMMGELGVFAEQGHRRVGAAAAVNGVDVLVTVGREAEWIRDEALTNGCGEVKHCEDVYEAAAIVKEIACSEDVVLVKGSRTAGMERILSEVNKL